MQKQKKQAKQNQVEKPIVAPVGLPLFSGSSIKADTPGPTQQTPPNQNSALQTQGNDKPISHAVTSVATEGSAEPYIDRHEVARRLGVTPRTVWEWMRTGFLPYYKIQRRVLFKWSEVQSELASKCHVCRERCK